MAYLAEATRKLEDGIKEGTGRREAEAMKKFVADKLKEFCRQDEEFAQAVVQGGKFKDCMLAVAKKVHGGSISDIDAYSAAVAFFFPGATIRVQMTIDLCGSVREDAEEEAATAVREAPAAEEAKPARKTKVLNLSDYL